MSTSTVVSRTRETIGAGAAALVLASVLALPTTAAHAEGADRSDIEFARYNFASGIRVATFNASLNRFNAGDLITDLSTPDDEQAQTVAEIIQRVNPDVLLVNEFDYDENAEAANLFRANYLEVSQNGATPVFYPYLYVAPSNTGIPSGFDLNNDGEIGGPDDAFGFGFFTGQFGMLVLSKYPIVADDVRTFQFFLWKDMPGALLPDDPDTPEEDDWYSPEELEVFRLSSKSHWDVPVDVDGQIIHVLASHPTPPVFDGPEDRNGRRNFDEIRFWADYIDPDASDYIYDDEGVFGGLAGDAEFVILGDQNSDPFDGDSIPGAAQQLLDSPLVNTSLAPASPGGIEQAALQGGANDGHIGNPAFDTADFNDDPAPGNLRADYALPSADLPLAEAGVFWPEEDDVLFPLVGTFPFPSSDHRLVWVDLALPSSTQPSGVAAGDVTQDSAVLWCHSAVVGDVTFEWSTDPEFSAFESTTVTATDILVPVKTEVAALMPGTTYYYRARDAAGSESTGTFRTARPTGEQGGFRFGVVTDWQQAPPYPLLKNIPDRDLEVAIKAGDTIYADLETPIQPGEDQARTLEQFRLKHHEAIAERVGVNFMRELYAATSVLTTTDDHEIVDNYAGGAAPGESPDADPPLFTDPVDFVNDTQAYEDAYQAYHEYHPINDEFWGETGDPRTANERKLYRYRTYGRDAAIILLDSRSFRDVQLPPISDPTDPVQIAQFIAATYDPTRTLLGEAQLEQVKQDLLDAEAAGIIWKFVVIPEPIQNFGVINAEDRFEGYAAERAELLAHIDLNDIDNVVFLAGDFHGTLVNNLTYATSPIDPLVATDAFEVVTGPVAFFNGLFGPAVIDLAAAAGLLTPEQVAFYQSLPVAPDLDSIPNDKDDFVKDLINAQTVPLGYDPMGLNDNLEIAEGLIDAELLQGDYVAAHTFSWAEFDIDPDTAALTVTLWAIDAYAEEDVLSDPMNVIDREPSIAVQFVVNPIAPCDADFNGDGDVNVDDLLSLIAAWGESGVPEDINNDGTVDVDDLGLLLAAWGAC